MENLKRPVSLGTGVAVIPILRHILMPCGVQLGVCIICISMSLSPGCFDICSVPVDTLRSYLLLKKLFH